MSTWKLGPVSSKHLRHIYVFKMSQDMFKTNIVFHQTLEIKGISLFVLYEGQINRCPSRYFCPKLYMHVLTMAAFQVILEADEDDNRPSLKQPRVYRYRYMFCFTILLFTDLHLYCLLVSELEAYLTPPSPPPPPTSGSTCRHITVSGSCSS